MPTTRPTVAVQIPEHLIEKAQRDWRVAHCQPNADVSQEDAVAWFLSQRPGAEFSDELARTLLRWAVDETRRLGSLNDAVDFEAVAQDLAKRHFESTQRDNEWDRLCIQAEDVLRQIASQEDE